MSRENLTGSVISGNISFFNVFAQNINTCMSEKQTKKKTVKTKINDGVPLELEKIELLRGILPT